MPGCDRKNVPSIEPTTLKNVFHGIGVQLHAFLQTPSIIEGIFADKHPPNVGESDLFLPVLYDHHVLLPAVSGTADIPHPAGLTGIITINKVL